MRYPNQNNQRPPAKLYKAELPYPTITIASPNQRYANMMLDNIGGKNSEISAMSLYFYNHLITREHQEISACFHNISIVEMQHMEMFGQLTLLLGEDPRLWTQYFPRKQYWTPAYNRYSMKMKELMANAIQSEKDSITKYQRQAQAIEDSNIQELLNRIIIDEELHVKILTELSEGL